MPQMTQITQIRRSIELLVPGTLSSYLCNLRHLRIIAFVLRVLRASVVFSS